MQISEVITVSRDPDSVWALFQDIPGLSQCLPGAELTEDKGDGPFARATRTYVSAERAGKVLKGAKGQDVGVSGLVAKLQASKSGAVEAAIEIPKSGGLFGARDGKIIVRVELDATAPLLPGLDRLRTID